VNVLENPDPRRFREARVGWENLFADQWPDGIPCFIERSNRRMFIVPLFTSEIAGQLVELYNDRHIPGVDVCYRWAGDRLLLLHPSDEIDEEDNGKRDISTIEEVDPENGLYHLDEGMLWDEIPHVDEQIEALRHETAAVGRGRTLAVRKLLVRQAALTA
jgi:hypothetical protein